MFELIVTAEAQAEFLALPLPIQTRVLAIFERLRHWPNVSGAKPLRGPLRGSFRIRTGDYRVLFRVDEPARRVTVFRIDSRRDVYER